MFHIKGQVQTSHLSNLQAYRPKYHFRDKVNPILSFYRIQNQIGSHIMFRIKGQVQTSHLSNLQAYRPKSLFSRPSHSNTFILLNTKPNTFETRSFQYFHFTEYKIKQARISCFASRDKFKHPIYKTCRHIVQNLIFATSVNPILLFYRIQNQIGSHIMFRIKGH